MSRLYLARVICAALAAAQLADVLSTNAALGSAPDAIEGNPLMRLAMAILGPYWWAWKAALGLFFLGFALRLSQVTGRTWLLLGIVAKAYALAILSNAFGWL